MQTLIISIAGIVATLIASALGLYFTARAHTAPLRQLLYTKQLELIIEVMELIGRVRTYSIILADPLGEFSEKARQDLGEAVPKLSRLTDVAAAILPTDVYVELNRLNSSVTSFLVAADEGQIDKAFPQEIGAKAAKVALLARSSLGIDELSEESLKLFGSTRELQRLAGLTAEDITSSVNDRAKKR